MNRARADAGIAPLRLSLALSEAAQGHASAIARAENLNDAAVSGADLVAMAARAGYRAESISQIVTIAEGDAADVVASWKSRSSAGWADVVDARHRDLGVGTARIGGSPLYVFLFAQNAEDAFAQKAGRLRDMARVRADMLAAVNRERAAKKLPPVRRSATLESVAQGHADDMVARGYYGHASPEGTMVMERVRRAGYAPERVGENLARGPGSVEEAVRSWMGSPEHRRNILDPFFTEAGFGVAFAKTPEGDAVLWVQVFGRPRSGEGMRHVSRP
jgi:uncharacterized protein YkwD